MTDPAVKKDIIKKHVRALLISSPAPLTANELKRDFHNFIGEPLNYREMGYVTIEDFFRDIQDVVTILFKNGMMTLRAKADETTKHIEKLVSKQKVNNKKKYAVYRSQGSGAPPRMYQGSNRYPPRRNPPNMLPPQPIVPAYVRNQIVELFKSFPNGVPVARLDTAFSRTFGTGINYRHYGFQNQHEFLQSLKDTVKVEEVERGEWYVLPVGYTKPVRTVVHPSNRTSVHNVQRTSTLQQDRQTDDRILYVTVQINDPKIDVQTRDGNLDSRSMKKKRPSKGRGRRREGSCGSDNTVGLDARSVGSNEEDHLELEIQQVLEKKPDGIWASRFTYEYTEVHGRHLDYRKHGYLSMIDFLSGMPDTVRTVRPKPQGDWMLYDARLPNPHAQEPEKSHIRHSSGKAMESETKEAMQKILNSKPCGIPVKDFPEVFKEYTGRKLPHEDLGFEFAEDFFLSLADSVLQFAYNGNEMLIYSMDTEIAEIRQEPSPSPPVPQSDDDPMDIVGPGCHFVPAMLPNPEQYVELYVSNVIDPGLFWVYIRHRTKSMALEELMDRLDAAYQKERDVDTYKIPENLLVPGQVCATLFPEDNNWHRGVITGANDAGFIQVYYVDYGNTCFVQKHTLRFLKSEYLILPAQAIQASLTNTYPPAGINTKWKTKSRNRLLELTCHRPLIAYVCTVKNQKMSVCLTDTNQPDVDIHINDVMVMEGLATFIPNAEGDTPVDAPKHELEPDYGHVFGWNITDTPRLPKVAQDNSSSQCDNVGVQQQCYVKWIQLNDTCVLHLINLGRQAYLVSAEISDLFWEEDILTSMLKKRRVDVEKRVVSSDELPQLFQELVQYRVKSVRCEGTAKQQFLSLYKLDSLPKILQVFEHDSETLLTAVGELIAKFDPDSPYWKSCEATEESGTENVDTIAGSIADEESHELQLSIEEKQMALQALQFKRKRILQSLMNDTGYLQDETVNKLNSCEMEIMMIKQKLQEHQSNVNQINGPAAKSTDKLSTRTSYQPDSCQKPAQCDLYTRDTTSENQRVIQNIIASATKPIAAANIMTKSTTSTSTSDPVTMANTSNNQSMMNQQFLMAQSMAGSYPGLMAAHNMAFTQQQRMYNPMFMAQTTSPQVGMGDMASSLMAGSLGLGAGLNPNFQMGLLPQLNPLLFQFQNEPGVGNVHQMANMATLGRGQTLTPSSVGILPGLLPLVQNLSAGRGRGGPGSSNKP